MRLQHKLVFRVVGAGQSQDLAKQERVPTDALDRLDQVVLQICTRVAAPQLGQQVVAFFLEKVQGRATGGVPVDTYQGPGTELTELAVEGYGLLLRKMRKNFCQCGKESSTSSHVNERDENDTYKIIKCFGQVAIHCQWSAFTIRFCKLEHGETGLERLLALEKSVRAAHEPTMQWLREPVLHLEDSQMHL